MTPAQAASAFEVPLTPIVTMAVRTFVGHTFLLLLLLLLLLDRLFLFGRFTNSIVRPSLVRLTVACERVNDGHFGGHFTDVPLYR